MGKNYLPLNFYVVEIGEIHMNNKKFNQVLSEGRTKLKEILQEMIDEKLFSEQSTKIPEVFELQNNYPNISNGEFLKIVNDYANFYYVWYKDKCKESDVRLLVRHGRMSDHIVFSPSPYTLTSSILWEIYSGSMSSVNIQKRAVWVVEEVLGKNSDFLDFLIENGYIHEEPTIEELETELDKQIRLLIGIKNNFEVCEKHLETALSRLYDGVKNVLDKLETGEWEKKDVC